MEKLGFYCSSTSWGGLEMDFIKSAIWLSKRKYNIKLYCVKGSPISDKLQTTDLDVTYVKRNRKYYDVVNAYRIHKLIKKDNIKGMWLNHARDLSTIGLAKTFSGNNVKIIYQQEMQISINKRDLLHTIRFSKIDAWIALLNFLSTQVKTNTKFDHKKIHVIPLAVDISQNHMDISTIQAREKFKLQSSKFVIGILGRIAPLKGQLFVIKQLAKLRDQNLDIELLIVGETTRGEGDEYMMTLNETIKKLNLNEFVHFSPFMDDVEVFYRAIDLFIMASTGETFGNVTIEAMDCGVPVLGTNSSGTPEILEEGNLGFLYEVNDGNDFCQKVNWILNNPEIVKEKAIMAKENANYKYSHKVVFDQIEEVLSKLDLTKCKEH